MTYSIICTNHPETDGSPFLMVATSSLKAAVMLVKAYNKTYKAHGSPARVHLTLKFAETV